MSRIANFFQLAASQRHSAVASVLSVEVTSMSVVAVEQPVGKLNRSRTPSSNEAYRQGWARIWPDPIQAVPAAN